MPYYAHSPREFCFKAHCMELIVKYEWPPNSLNLNHSTINVRDAMLQTFYKLNLKLKTIL